MALEITIQSIRKTNPLGARAGQLRLRRMRALGVSTCLAAEGAGAAPEAHAGAHSSESHSEHDIGKAPPRRVGQGQAAELQKGAQTRLSFPDSAP